MAVKKKQIRDNSVLPNPIYYTMDNGLYIESKKNILSAKSNVLISRNYAMRYSEYCQSEDVIRTEITKIMNKINTSLRKVKSNLPSVTLPSSGKKKSVAKKTIPIEIEKDIKSQIDYELEEINNKLRELAGL